MTSEDGVSWSSRPSGTSNYIERLYWAGGWVAVCEEGDILTSDDGLSWTAAKTSVATDHEGVTYGDGLWVVVGGYFGKSAHSTTYVSSNRTNWTLLPFTIGLRLRDIAFGKGDFVAVGNDGLVAVFSKTRNPLEPLKVEGHYVATGANFRRIVFSRGQFIAVCNNGEILSSLNPRLPSSWIHHRSHTSQNLHDILARPDGTFIAIGNNGMILHSGESQPYFEGIQVQGNDVILDFVLPKRPGPFRLEGSADMSSWVILPDAVVSPARIPVNNQSPRYFRVTAP